MKYELIPKNKLDEVCGLITEVENLINVPPTEQSWIETDKEMKLILKRAYQSIQHNRTACNVQPEQP